MIYLNQAGTSWPKPDAVHEAAAAALRAAPETWSAAFHAHHARVARFFGVPDASRLLLTPGCTSALAVGIADHAWAAGDRLLTSALEHHGVGRPAALLAQRGVEVLEIPRAADGPIDLAHLEAALAAGGTRLIACTAACNVTGELLPVGEIARLAHAHGALCLIDGAQVCGWLDLDLPGLGADLFAFGGHKGLHAPWGVGGLYVADHMATNTPAAACEVGDDDATCATMPGYCDVGSVDLPALAGLAAALDWLEAPAQADRLERARAQVECLAVALEARGDARVLGVRDPARRLPTIAFAIDGVPSARVAGALRAAGVIAAAGLQCAPRAHEALGTAPDGAVRISAGPLLSDEDAARAGAILAALDPRA